MSTYDFRTKQKGINMFSNPFFKPLSKAKNRISLRI